MALADARKNFATSLVATAPSPATSGTSLVVTGGEGTRFPAVPFNAVIAPAGASPTSANAEVVRVTTISTDTFTITRTQEGSSARTVIVGDRIYQALTAVDYPAPSAVGSITTIQPDDAAAAGTAESYARGDHKHAIVAAAAGTITGTAAEGSSTSFARADHDHGLPGWGGAYMPASPVVSAPASAASGVTNTWYAVPALVFAPVTLTGITYRVGATALGNVRCALFDSGGTRVANLTANVAQATANTVQRVAFDGTYVAAPGGYYCLITFFNAGATWIGARSLGVSSTGVQASTTPTSIGIPGIADADRPLMLPY